MDGPEALARLLAFFPDARKRGRNLYLFTPAHTRIDFHREAEVLASVYILDQDLWQAGKGLRSIEHPVGLFRYLREMSEDGPDSSEPRTPSGWTTHGSAVRWSSATVATPGNSNLKNLTL